MLLLYVVFLLPDSTSSLEEGDPTYGASSHNLDLRLSVERSLVGAVQYRNTSRGICEKYLRGIYVLLCGVGFSGIAAPGCSPSWDKIDDCTVHKTHFGLPINFA